MTIRARSASVAGTIGSRAVAGPGRSGSSITIETEGDIVVSGRATAGSGTGGAAEGNGGDVTLRSSAGDITIGTPPPGALVDTGDARLWAGEPCPDDEPPVVPPDGSGGRTNVPGSAITGSGHTTTTPQRFTVRTADDFPVGPAYCDTNGYYVVSGCLSGTYFLAPDGSMGNGTDGTYWFPASREMAKVAGTPLSGQGFELRTATQHTLTVPVQDEAGAQKEGVQLALHGIQGGTKYATSGPDGNAVFTDVWSHWYELQVLLPGPPAGYVWQTPPMFYVTDSDLTTAVVKPVAD